MSAVSCSNAPFCSQLLTCLCFGFQNHLSLCWNSPPLSLWSGVNRSGWSVKSVARPPWKPPGTNTTPGSQRGGPAGRHLLTRWQSWSCCPAALMMMECTRVKLRMMLAVSAAAPPWLWKVGLSLTFSYLMLTAVTAGLVSCFHPGWWNLVFFVWVFNFSAAEMLTFYPSDPNQTLFCSYSNIIPNNFHSFPNNSSNCSLFSKLTVSSQNSHLSQCAV